MTAFRSLEGLLRVVQRRSAVGDHWPQCGLAATQPDSNMAHRYRQRQFNASARDQKT